MKARFRLPMTEELAAKWLTAAYRLEVDARHMKYADDAETAENIRRLARFITREDGKFGAMICGTCGNGKTTLLYALQYVLNHLTNHGYLKSGTGIRIEAATDIPEYSSKGVSWKSLKEEELLAIDDFGREPAEVMSFGNIRNPISDLMEYRYDNQLFTLMTTNLTGKEVRAKYGDRIADRFNEMLEVIPFYNGSYRR